jgi:hypothetical protein
MLVFFFFEVLDRIRKKTRVTQGVIRGRQEVTAAWTDFHLFFQGRTIFQSSGVPCFWYIRYHHASSSHSHSGKASLNRICLINRSVKKTAVLDVTRVTLLLGIIKVAPW